MPWQPKALTNLERENAGLRSEIVKLCSELRTKQTQVGGLELALRERSERIYALQGRLEQARAAQAWLEQECDHWYQLLRLESASPDRLNNGYARTRVHSIY